MINNKRKKENKGYDMKTISVRRVAKVNQGGKRLRFSAMVVVGDKKGNIGIGLGRGADPRSAIGKGEKKAVKTMQRINLVGDTIPHEIEQKFGAARVLLRPAKHGTGVIAGSSVRTVLELAGIENVYGKLLGSNDPIANTYCAYEALLNLRNDRVLEKMRDMRERIELKEKTNAERKEREMKKRASKKKSKKVDSKKSATKKKIDKK
ncbi:MAG: 30S ribosomal protein S5 [Candidatus Dojkabacteria bacterium]|nr:30S ribosomal protein S5 [Candidatus Dojkabacteria bacterium]